MSWGKRVNIEIPSIRHAGHISFSEKKWEGAHPGTHKTLQRMLIGSFSLASGELFIAKSWYSVVKKKQARMGYWKPCIIHTFYFKQLFLMLLFYQFSTRLINKESIYNLVFNVFVCHLLTGKNKCQCSGSEHSWIAINKQRITNEWTIAMKKWLTCFDPTWLHHATIRAHKEQNWNIEPNNLSNICIT